MSSRDWRLRVGDILQAIAEIQQDVAGLTSEQFAANRRIVRSVLYSYIIIGEAVRNIPEPIQVAPEIP